jgi:hypothetical protein
VRIDRPSHERADRAPRPSEPSADATRGRRSAWTLFQRLLWTSTVASACTTTRVETAPIAEPLPSGLRGEIVLSLKSGRDVSMYEATLVQDSIVGLDRPASDTNGQRVAVARADVRSVATKKLSFGKTLLAVAGGTVAAFTFVVLAACASLSAT